MPEFYVPPAGIAPLSEAYLNGAALATAARNWLADKIDPTTGELVSIVAGADPIDAAVAYAFQVKLRKGPANGSAGHEFFKIRKAGERSKKAIEDEARRIMAPFIARGWVSFRTGDGLVVSVDLDTGSLVINYYNRVARARRTPTFTF